MYKVGLPRSNIYTNVEYDRDGWADAKRFLPADYDLCHLKIQGKKTISGWSTGNKWDGLNLKPQDEVLFWKINKDKEGVFNATSKR